MFSPCPRDGFATKGRYIMVGMTSHPRPHPVSPMRRRRGRSSPGHGTPRDMLGTGNAFSHGRHHSFAMFDRKHIIDVPPTALAGLAVTEPMSPRSARFSSRTFTVTMSLGFLFVVGTKVHLRQRVQNLSVVGTPFVKERLSLLCQLAFPVLDSTLTTSMGTRCLNHA